MPTLTQLDNLLLLLALEHVLLGVPTCCIEESKDLAIGLCGDGRLPSQVVRLDTVASCDLVLAHNHAESLLLRQIKHLLRLALDQQLAQLVG